MTKTVKDAKTFTRNQRVWVEKQYSKFMNDDIKNILLDEEVLHFLELNATNIIKYSFQKIKAKKEIYLDKQSRDILNRYIHLLIDLQQMDILNMVLNDTQLNNKYRFMRAFEKVRSIAGFHNFVVSVDYDNQDHYMDIDVGLFMEKVYQQLDRIEKIENGFKDSMEFWIELVKKIRSKQKGHTDFEDQVIIHYFLSRVEFEKLYHYRDELNNSPYPPTSIIQYINTIIEEWEKEYQDRGIFLLKRLFPKIPSYAFNSAKLELGLSRSKGYSIYNEFRKNLESAISIVIKDLHTYDIQVKTHKPSNELFSKFINDYHLGVTKPLLDCNSDSRQIPYVFKDWIKLILHKANHFSWKMTGVLLQQVDIY
nr:MAG TPA: hypothetical protein [Caudoviricetes sp.]